MTLFKLSFPTFIFLFVSLKTAASLKLFCIDTGWDLFALCDKICNPLVFAQKVSARQSELEGIALQVIQAQFEPTAGQQALSRNGYFALWSPIDQIDIYLTLSMLWPSMLEKLGTERMSKIFHTSVEMEHSWQEQVRIDFTICRVFFTKKLDSNVVNSKASSRWLFTLQYSTFLCPGQLHILRHSRWELSSITSYSVKSALQRCWLFFHVAT